MSQTFQIDRIDVVPFNKNNEQIDMVYIRLVGKPKEYSLGRKFGSFLADLKSSYLLPQSVTSMEDTRVLKLLRRLKKGYVSGEIAFQKAGSKYTIDETHPAITNQKHTLYGKVSVGDEVEVQKDGSRIKEGMLDFEISDRAFTAEVNAEAYAEKQAELMNFLNSVQAPTKTTTVVDEETEETSEEEELSLEVVGQGGEKTE